LSATSQLATAGKGSALAQRDVLGRQLAIEQKLGDEQLLLLENAERYKLWCKETHLLHPEHFAKRDCRSGTG
jgi:hypothetical protein